MDYRDSHVLVTGGAGFIGSALARRLVALGANVTVVDSFIPEYGGTLENLVAIRDDITLNIADVRDPHSMKVLVRGMDVVFNMAGQTSHMDSMSDPFTDLEINAKAQLSILESVRHNSPSAIVVFASTRQIYGRPQYLPVDERHPRVPVDVNGINKVAGEDYHRLYHDVYGLRTCSLRLTNTYGPGMRIKDARQTFLGIWIKRVLQDQPFEVWGGAQLRDFNYVDDVVAAFLGIAFEPRAYGKAFNLGASPPCTLTDLARTLVRVAGRGSFEIRSFPDDRKLIDIGDYYSDFTGLAECIGWQPEIGLEQGLDRSLAYFRTRLGAYA